MRRRLLPWLIAGLVLAGLGSARADPMLAEVTVNGAATGAVVTFERQGDELQIGAGDLRDMGFASTPGGVGDTVTLSALTGVSYHIDEARQAVDIVADPRLLAVSDLRQGRGEFQPPDRPPWGAVLNYGGHLVTSGDGDIGAAALGELRVFGPYGTFFQGFTARKAVQDRDSGVRRLDTAFVFEDAQAARRFTVGDFVSSSLSWTPAVRAAGISLSTDFTLRPDLITQPLPRVKGTAAAPSTVELYVDGVRRFTSPTAPGPFSVDMTPMMDGRGQLNLVVTDALGRQTVQSLPFYAARDLLAPGAAAFAVEAGWLRDAYASDDDRYTDPFATAVARRGLSDHATFEGHLTAAGDIRTAGAGVVGKIGEAALVSAAFNASHSDAGGGGKVRLSARRQTGAYSLFATLEQASSAYREPGWRLGGETLRQSVQLGAAMRTNQWGTVSASYNRIRTANTDFSVTGVNWTRGFGPVEVYVNALTSQDRRSTTVVSLGLTASLRRERSFSAVTTSSEGRARLTTQMSAPPPAPSGWGWRVAAEGGGGSRAPPRLEGEIRRTSGYGEVGMGLSRQNSRVFAQAYGSGALVLIDGRVRPAAQIGESFALIDTGEPNVALTVENRPIGRTGADGRLLAVQLPSRSASRIAIDTDTVSLDREILVQTKLVRPPRGSGVIAALPVRQVHSATLQFVDGRGLAIPVGARVRLNGRDAGRVGLDGEAFLSGLLPKNVLDINDESGECRLEAHYAPIPDAIPRIGPLVCVLGPPGDPLGLGLRRAERGPGGELPGADGGSELRRVRHESQPPDRFERRVRGDAVHLQRPRLHRLWLQYLNPIRWFRGRGEPAHDTHRRHGDLALRSLP